MGAATAETIRIATFHTELSARSPAAMLHSILRQDPVPVAIAQHIANAQADIIVLQGIDYDTQHHGLNALRDLIAQHGLHYPHSHMPHPNSGFPLPSDPTQQKAYGAFPGQRSIAILSRFPLLTDQAHSFTDTLWHHAAPHLPPIAAPPDNIPPDLPLSSTAHLAIPIDINGRQITLLTHHATPPNFDSPLDENGARNAAENLFWLAYLKGAFAAPLPAPYILAVNANIDPNKGDGRKSALQTLLQSNLLQDPLKHLPQADQHTVHWPAPGPGKLRVSYLLPSANLRISGQGITPALPQPNPSKTRISRHRLIWVDLHLP